jgi:hypothetical protein
VARFVAFLLPDLRVSVFAGDRERRRSRECVRPGGFEPETVGGGVELVVVSLDKAV